MSGSNEGNTMDTYGTRAPLRVGDRTYEISSLPLLERQGFAVSRLPYSLRILLENLLRHEDGVTVTADDVAALARWSPTARSSREIAFTPARVVLQDFTGVPALVDLAAMRDAMVAMGGDALRVDPQTPVELVVDHSIQVDAFGSADAFARNEALDYARNRERYAFLRWGQRAFDNLRVTPPNTGIVHQVNLEHLARVVFADDRAGGTPVAYPDTLVGTDSHTPMVNGLGVLGWGVGGIEAEAVMLGQPLSLLVPRVVGVRLVGALREGVTATDLVLHVTETLRKHGVVGAFVEFFGEGIGRLPLADRATIGNMSPEYGATCAIFPPDAVTLEYLRLTGRERERVALVEAYMKEQGLFWTPDAPEPLFSEVLTLDLTSIEPSLAGPRRPQDRVRLSDAGRSFRDALPGLLPDERPLAPAASLPIDHGSVVIAAITSCTNTSNPSVMMAAGLLARNAAARGLTRKPWVKTSLAPGSKVVTAYYARAGLLPALESLGFHVVGYGCTTCIGNSGPLPPDVSDAIAQGGLVAVAVLSGNRNFEGRIHAEVRANYLASPPLVVAYALAGRIDHDFERDPLGLDTAGNPVFLRDIWPAQKEIQELVARCIVAEMYRRNYAEGQPEEPRWSQLDVPRGDSFVWEPASTYVRRPPWFEGMVRDAATRVPDIVDARVLVSLGDSVTTDHISPAGAIRPGSPAGKWLAQHGVAELDFNSYGSRRGNHEVMLRGTFASGRLRNRLVPGVEGGWTKHLPSGDVLPIFDAAERYRVDGTPLLVLAGRDYGSGSSRDWAAKGTALLGVRAVIAESYERIHRSNLVGMGVLPLEFPQGETAASLGLDGTETWSLRGLAASVAAPGGTVHVVARRANGEEVAFVAAVRIDTPVEVLYFQNGGILPYVLRQLLGAGLQPASGAVPAGAQRPPQEPCADEGVEEGSKESFPASDPPVY